MSDKKRRSVEVSGLPDSDDSSDEGQSGAMVTKDDIASSALAGEYPALFMLRRLCSALICVRLKCDSSEYVA